MWLVQLSKLFVFYALPLTLSRILVSFAKLCKYSSQAFGFTKQKA